MADNEEKRPLISAVHFDENPRTSSQNFSEPSPLPEFDSDRPVSAAAYAQIIGEVRYAVSKGIYPVMISQGSSGSYFCKDRNGNIVGVFKPKDEEPYGHLNPKWSKFFQRTCCPCCFGRGCLIANSGYISEASASLVDQKLGLEVVPRTEIVSLASPTFSYRYFDRRRNPLPHKVGSFQIFVRGYKDAIQFIKQMQADQMPEPIKLQFRLKFERLVILDYITRNTDRGSENWLIKCIIPTEDEIGDPGFRRHYLNIAAIDNGLSFPFKHPDSWRTYPFGWASLPAAQVPFSEGTKSIFLEKLIDPDWTENLILELKKIAQIDPDFNERQFSRQMAVIRGQIFNLVEALMKQRSPLELVQMTPLTIKHVDTSSGFRRRLMSLRMTAPTFSWC